MTQELKIVRFVNFTDEDFIGKWNGVPQLIPSGSSIPMEEWRARHYAKHLINRELQSRLPNGAEKYKNGEKFTSPRNPEQIPLWVELLGKCIIDEGVKVNPDHAVMEVAKQVEVPGVKETPQGIPCDKCSFVAKTNVGLIAHQRKHKLNA